MPLFDLECAKNFILVVLDEDAGVVPASDLVVKRPHASAVYINRKQQFPLTHSDERRQEDGDQSDSCFIYYCRLVLSYGHEIWQASRDELKLVLEVFIGLFS